MTGKYMYIHHLHMHVPKKVLQWLSNTLIRTKDNCYHNHQKQARQKNIRTSQPPLYHIWGSSEGVSFPVWRSQLPWPRCIDSWLALNCCLYCLF